MGKFISVILALCCLSILITACKNEDVFRNYAETESFNSSAVIIDLTDSTEIVYAENGTELIDYKHNVTAGEYTSLTIKSEAFREYRIEVEYASGISQSKYLTPKTSDHNGYVTWNWQVGTKCHAGKYPVRIYKSNELIFETRLTIK